MADHAFNILSLCSGVGMLDEGVGLAVPGGRTVCYVERESGAAAILLARMGDKALEPAPVWCGNLEDFDVCPWAHALDCVTAGFPCQPHSQAGARKSVEDERWIWPAIADLIRRILKARDAVGEIRPFHVFLENVRGLLTSGDGGAFAQVLADLADMGFDAEWGLLSAAEVGASHQRERVFILGIRPGIRSLDESSERRRVDGGSGQHAATAGVEAFGESEPGSDSVAYTGCESEQLQQRPYGAELEGIGGVVAEPIQLGFRARGIPDGQHDWCKSGANGEELGDSECPRRQKARRRYQKHPRRESESRCRCMAYAESGRSQEQRGMAPQRRKSHIAHGSNRLANPSSSNDQGGGQSHDQTRWQEPSRHAGLGSGGVFAPGPAADWRGISEHLYPAIESGVRVLVDGLAVVVDESRADQLRCIGNGVVPLEAAVAFRILNSRLKGKSK